MDFSIKSMMAVGLLATVMFSMLTLGYAFTKTEPVVKLMDTTMKTMGGKAEIPSIAVTGAEWYFLINTASFTGAKQAVYDNIKVFAEQQIAGAGAYGAFITVDAIMNMIKPMIDPLFPDPTIYYVIGILSGFVPGLFFLTKKSKWMDGLLAGIIPGIVMTIVVVVITTVASGMIPADVPIKFSLTGGDYALVFFMAFLMVLIGAMLAAVVREFVWKAKVTA